jgi:hypothetical protein
VLPPGANLACAKGEVQMTNPAKGTFDARVFLAKLGAGKTIRNFQKK